METSPLSAMPSTYIPNGSSTSSSSLSECFVLRKQNAAMLAAHYTTTKRAMEWLSVILFLVSVLACLRSLAGQLVVPHDFWILPCSSILAMLLADLFSGLVHWASDTWGTLETPFVGKT